MLKQTSDSTTADLNAFRGLATAILLGVIGPEVFIVQPAITIESGTGRDDRAGNAAIADQHVAAETQPVDRHVGRQLGEKRDEIGAIGRLEILRRRAAATPPRSRSCRSRMSDRKVIT